MIAAAESFACATEGLSLEPLPAALHRTYSLEPRNRPARESVKHATCDEWVPGVPGLRRPLTRGCELLAARCLARRRATAPHRARAAVRDALRQRASRTSSSTR